MNPATCSVADCDKPVRTRGLCNAHHLHLLRYGDTKLRRIRNGAARAFLDAATQCVGDDCLLWPYAKSNGYGSIGLDGKTRRANNIVCERIHGPLPGMDAAHSCGNRACVNPKHLHWKTRSENEADKLAHGRSKRGKCAKLTETDILYIRASDRNSHELAAELQVAASTIRAIRQRKNWSWV